MEDCLKCGGHLITTSYSTSVCTQCGIEERIGLVQEQTYVHSAPLDRSYSRPDRWKGLIKKLTGHHSGPTINDPVWGYLKKHEPYKDPQEIIHRLRKSKLLNKHYQSTFIFTKVFSTMKLPKNNERVCKQLISYFDFIYRLWNRHNFGKPFFSYNWLIEQALYFFNETEYLPFVKKLVCEKRRKKYKKQLFILYGTHLGYLNCKPQEPRYECEKSNSCSLQSLFGGPPCLLYATLDQHTLDSQLCPECTRKALRDVEKTCSSCSS